MKLENTRAEALSARAAELSVEQQARYQAWCAVKPVQDHFNFYLQLAEAQQSIIISNLMYDYAIFMGFINPQKLLTLNGQSNQNRPEL